MWTEFKHDNCLYRVRIEHHKPTWIQILFDREVYKEYCIHIQKVDSKNTSVIQYRFSKYELCFYCNDMVNQTLTDLMKNSDEKYEKYLIATAKELIQKQIQSNRITEV